MHDSVTAKKPRGCSFPVMCFIYTGVTQASISWAFFPIRQILLYIGLMCLTCPVGFYHTFVKQGLCYSGVSAVYGERKGPSATVGKQVRASFSGNGAEKSYAAMATSVNWNCVCYTTTGIMTKGAKEQPLFLQRTSH